MNFLDMRTVILGHFFTNMLCTAVLVFVWVRNRKRFAGTGWWLSDFAFQTLALALVILRGYLPDWVSMTVSNTLVIAGALLGYIGLTLFVGKKSPQLHNYALLMVFALVHSYFVYVKPDLAARNLNLSLGLLAVCFQCAWLILHRVEPDMRRMARGVGNVFGMFCLVSLVRIVVTLVNPSPNNDFFQSGLFDTIILMTYQILLILLAFNLITMVNQRLLGDIQFQEKKYATAFRSSPYAITLTRLSDGKILDVNDGFTDISGYSCDEVVGKTTLELNLWDRQEDRAVVTGELSQGRRVLGREFQFRKKSGEMIIGRLTAEVITIYDQLWVLSSIDDITERKRAEDALREQEALLRAMAENYPNSYMSIIEKDLTIGFTSGQEFKKLNLDPNQFVGLTLEQVFGEYAPLVRENYLRTFDGAETRFELFINNQHQHYRTVPLVDRDGRIHRILAVVENITERKQMENELRAQRHALAERVKELNCLYGVASLIETPHISLEEILQGTVELLPPAWQQPRQTCARLTLQEQTYQTSNFQQTDWRLSSGITLNGSPIGMLEVFLLLEPVHDDEVFLPEEAKLLDAVAERISRVIERAGVEETLRENEIIFSSFLENSPVYVFFKDKNIRTLRLSRNYEQMLGMPVGETIGKSMDELFPSPLAQSMVADDLRILKEGKRVDIVEELNGRFYETTKFPIYMDGKPEMLAGFTMDITDRKRSETILQMRLKLLEFAALHSLDELMQYALDEVGELTQSSIGFYHFVEPDEKTLSLQAWSTRTLQEFCQAEGKDLHYPIDQAGVWVDCIAQRKPVIHNDYESLPHRKGLPPGHAQVVRELVAPIFRDGRVVAILGVGNKPIDYDETDAASVSYIADVVFEIVKRKQAEEDLKKAAEQLFLRLTEIEELHEELREQSIRDPLTGAYNRRYMQDVIMREFARAVRENFPVSVIMLDMDELKMFNDTYGHHIGDRAIQMLASQVKDMIRTEDIICRFGGDEFIIILSKTSPENAIKRVSEWREALNNHPLAVEDRKMPVQFTAGIASFPAHGSTMEEVINYADVALYRAKARGRNCTIVFA